MKTPHKHAELIKAWADGFAIEYFNKIYKKWIVTENPQWDDCDISGIEYRIKPEPKPDVVDTYKADARQKYGHVRIAEHWEKDNLKLTFDGETGKLKFAEVI